ncbi:DUF3576 domain-containing protein [Candidatus Trichorickettsia mobilis]|uniref:DUF3576 domain-containing protein n=1 Tax=Candidatus Trichorickettsia mobilis TaxID=1346319 RepID=A0ABZ0UW43_9RICK|nr:DUF3576 domain-containing protein [Candidatus Trichorickettsia mobilis]WPY01317.1 DUF3576 domain-containing protein [Candidatus Trichorickettsia mobilis]
MKNISYCLLIIFFICSFANNLLATNDNYPKTREERKAEEMGSMLGGDGIVFAPGKIKNESTKNSVGSVNKYLWQAAIETLNFAPLAAIDSTGGVIITEWYSPKNKPQFSFKINLFIKDTVISPDAIEVKVFSKTLKNGNWTQNDKPSDLAPVLEDKILRRARELYIQSERKE